MIGVGLIEPACSCDVVIPSKLQIQEYMMYSSLGHD